jgi:hypothetical protein
MRYSLEFTYKILQKKLKVRLSFQKSQQYEINNKINNNFLLEFVYSNNTNHVFQL